MRYMMPYQCTRSGPMPKKGPIDTAMGLMLGYVSMRSTLNRRSRDRNRLSDTAFPESPGAPGDRAPDRRTRAAVGACPLRAPPWQSHLEDPRRSHDTNMNTRLGCRRRTAASWRADSG